MEYALVGRIGRYTNMAGCIRGLRWQSVDTVWHRFRYAGISVGCAKTGILETQVAVAPSSNPL